MSRVSAPCASAKNVEFSSLYPRFFDEDEEDEDESSPYDFSRRHPSNHTGVTSDSASERRVANILRVSPRVSFSYLLKRP